MNRQQILTNSKNFYRSHNLESWAKALSSATAQVTRAEKLGLEQALAFPDFTTQMASIATVIAETALQPITGISIEPKSQELGKFY